MSLDAAGPAMAGDLGAVLRVFEAFVQAVQTGDAEAFRALAVEDAPPEVDLFLRNSERVRREGLVLRPRGVDREADVAEVRFDVLDGGGEPVDEAAVTFSLEPGGWRLRGL
jgi:hypothetical protein